MDYKIIGTWYNHDIYDIPIVDLLGVRSPVVIRKLSKYSYFVNKFLEGFKTTTPLICFVAGDGMIRVQHGNLVWLAAKETKQLKSLPCVFPKGSVKDSPLILHHNEDYWIDSDTRYF